MAHGIFLPLTEDTLNEIRRIAVTQRRSPRDQAVVLLEQAVCNQTPTNDKPESEGDKE